MLVARVQVQMDIEPDEHAATARALVVLWYVRVWEAYSGGTKLINDVLRVNFSDISPVAGAYAVNARDQLSLGLTSSALYRASIAQLPIKEDVRVRRVNRKNGRTTQFVLGGDTPQPASKTLRLVPIEEFAYYLVPNNDKRGAIPMAGVYALLVQSLKGKK
jgi:hypothetical protein